jgi:hypothetical protein
MMYTLKKNITGRSSRFKKPLLIAAGVIIALGAILAALEYTDTTYLLHDRPTTKETQESSPNRTAGQDTKGEQADPGATDGSKPNSAGSSTTPDAKAPEENTDTSAPLVTPTGNFVNSHKVKVDSAANTQQSVCVTTAGARCEIIFTKGSETRSLPAQTTDKGGATYWTWSPESVGLGVGSWKITAKATLGSQTKTASDAINLEVNP